MIPIERAVRDGGPDLEHHVHAAGAVRRGLRSACPPCGSASREPPAACLACRKIAHYGNGGGVLWKSSHSRRGRPAASGRSAFRWDWSQSPRLAELTYVGRWLTVAGIGTDCLVAIESAAIPGAARGCGMSWKASLLPAPRPVREGRRRRRAAAPAGRQRGGFQHAAIDCLIHAAGKGTKRSAPP